MLQFDENQKLRNELKLEVKEKQTAISINKDLRERLHELQLKESQSHRLASRVKDLEKLLVNSSASGLHEEKALRSMHELDEVRTQLMAAENAVSVSTDPLQYCRFATAHNCFGLGISMETGIRQAKTETKHYVKDCLTEARVLP